MKDRPLYRGNLLNGLIGAGLIGIVLAGDISFEKAQKVITIEGYDKKLISKFLPSENLIAVNNFDINSNKIPKKIAKPEYFSRKDKAELIEKYGILRFNKDVIDDLRKKVGKFQDYVNENGGLEEFTRVYSGHELEALRNLMDGEYTISDKEKNLRNTRKNLASRDRHADYDDKRVVRALKIADSLRARFFERLLEVDLERKDNCNGKDFIRLVRKAYTNENLEEYVKEQQEVVNELNEAIYKSISGFYRSFAAVAINEIKVRQQQAFVDLMEKVYGTIALIKK